MDGTHKRMDLLLIEDNPGDVRLTREALREAPIAVNLSIAEDGVEALEFLRKQGKYKGAPRPDLILLDLNLPKMSGSEVLSRIKSDPDLKRIPVVVMTTSSEPGDVEKMYSLNANCYIAKPIQFEEFINVVQSIESFWLKTVILPAP